MEPEPDDGEMICLRPRIRARFQPLNLATLKPGVAQFIGQEAEFRPLWLIDEGAYIGQIAYEIPRHWQESAECVWCPAGDLQPASKETT